MLSLRSPVIHNVSSQQMAMEDKKRKNASNQLCGILVTAQKMFNSFSPAFKPTSSLDAFGDRLAKFTVFKF